MTNQYVLDTPVVRAFVSTARDSIRAAPSPRDACAAIRPHFASLLADPDWLPDEYRAAAPEADEQVDAFMLDEVADARPVAHATQ